MATQKPIREMDYIFMQNPYGGGGNIHGKQFNEGCKVEFNQPFCWLYSVPNFLVF